MSYIIEKCKTKEQLSLAASKYAAQGMKPAGVAIKLGDEWQLAFVPATTNTHSRPFHISQGWKHENMLCTLGKVGVGLSQTKPKEPLTAKQMLAAKKRLEIKEAKILADAKVRREFLDALLADLRKTIAAGKNSPECNPIR